MRKKRNTANGAITIIIGIAYIGLLVLFGWQTWQFVNFLFPTDALEMKVLTLISFDVLALVWACADLFYSFADSTAKGIVRWAWGVTFVLSMVASVLYLVIQSMFRFHLAVTDTMVNIGYGISIIALVYNIVSMMFFLYLEWVARHPHKDEFEDEEELPPLPASVSPAFSPEERYAFEAFGRQYRAFLQSPANQGVSDEELYRRWEQHKGSTNSTVPLAPAPTSTNGTNGAKPTSN